MPRPNPTGHPARYSEAIVQLLAEIVLAEYPNWFDRPMIFDPCAGTGEALAEFVRTLTFKDSQGFHVRGIEIEAAYIVENIVEFGDATDIDCYPTPANYRMVIMTSPVYPNGIADSFRPRDDSTRHTYLASLMKRTDNPNYELHPNNQGAFGYRGTKRFGPSKRRDAYWDLAAKMVENWAKVAELVLLNVSDFKHSKGEIEPLVADWRSLLAKHGFTDQLEIPVGTPRMRNGANSDQRVDVEVIVKARRG